MGGFRLSTFFNVNRVENCNDILIMTQLFSPNPSVVGKLKTGNELVIKLNGEHGPCVAIFDNEIAGTIITKNLYQLINCIKKGIRFIAIVRNTAGGSCSITIQVNNE
jgi:hypothetical protein